jgi:hypothetical protein
MMLTGSTVGRVRTGILRQFAALSTGEGQREQSSHLGRLLFDQERKRARRWETFEMVGKRSSFNANTANNPAELRVR